MDSEHSQCCLTMCYLGKQNPLYGTLGGVNPNLVNEGAHGLKRIERTASRLFLGSEH